MKVYVVIELPKEGVPKIIGTYKNKRKDEEIAYSKDAKEWRNVVEQTVQ